MEVDMIQLKSNLIDEYSKRTEFKALDEHEQIMAVKALDKMEVEDCYTKCSELISLIFSLPPPL